MTKLILTIGLVSGLLGIFGCNNQTTDKTLQAQTNGQEMKVTVETLKKILEAFNRHDLDGIMEFFSDDCSFDFPRGSEPWGNASLVRHRYVKRWPVALKEFLMFTTVKTAIGFPPMEIWEYQNGHLPGQQLQGLA